MILAGLGGSLGWEVLERILYRMGAEVHLGIGPIGFDLSVLAVSLTVNPGTFMGLLSGLFLFRLL